MRFTVPQFVEREPKIIGPMTLKQFMYIGTAGAVCFVLYYLAPFIVFLAACLVLGVLGFALAFLKVGGKSLPALLASYLKFSISPKIYIWRKKEKMIEVFNKSGEKEEKKVEEPEITIKLTKDGQLKKIKTQVDTK